MVCATSVVLFLLSGWKAGDFWRGKRVGIVEIVGVIEDSWFPVQALQSFAQDDRIAAILLRVDSPGGGVAPSQEIFREVEKAVEIKPVVVSMGSMATSGGYYAGACADGIMANPGTITGSIGAIIEYFNYSELLDKVGLYPVVIKSGKFKDMANPTRKLTSEEEALLQKNLESIHEQFVEDVAWGRNLDPEAVRALANGQIFTGKEALDLGLVDSLGNLRDAIDWAGELGGLSGEIDYEYAEFEERGFWTSLLDYTASKLSKVVVNHPRFSYLYRPGQ